MGSFRILAACVLALSLLLPGFAGAQEPAKTFAVLPFTINGPDKYQYLSRGIQDMLVSRLSWPDKLVALDKDKVAAVAPAAPAGEAEAAALLPALGADYVVWGSVTMLGEQCSVDVRTTGAQGTAPESAQAELGGLIPALEDIAKRVNASVFQREAPAVQAQAKKRVNALNPDLVHNQRDAAVQEYYINPEFRYQGSEDTPGRWRSPSLPFISVGMICGDADGDGKTEMFFLGETKIHAYRLEGDKFQPLGEISPGGRTEMLNINLIDLNNDGLQEIVVSGFFRDEPNSFIYNFKDGQFIPVAERIKLFLNVAKMPPTYQPVLVGQRPGRNNVLNETPVHEVVKLDGKFALGKRIPLPTKANVFNFAYLPQQGTDYKILIIDSEDRINVYTPRFDLLATTMEQYGGSALGFEVPDTMPGFATYRDQYVNIYYLPLRMLITDLNSDGQFEVLVNKDISVAAQFFQRYRFFPNGELHSMFWDGVGMSLSWKTRRIKGTVTDYGLADLNNDGVMDLYVCLNTYPGAAGIAQRKTVIFSYSLDLEKTDGPLDRQAE
ncbi:VCBS repeat-containing protein [Desulfocurvus sp.]|uniref:FG-GAP repeat domain-containing protein n=1 Tax=Desulfocurvus sp. TaxID=2871698 RepID=UPI0025C74072|nr:VCBS repeat-containing protein [Desulfocurvus sp.]MCK9239014.1 VCBS repeat-containing protein [Desulfocurvus sp.]